MFTGLIEDIGHLKAINRVGVGAVLKIETALPLVEVKIGDSIAVNGACLTVTALFSKTFDVDCSRETMERTAFAGLRVGAELHLERALRLSDRLDGHMVSGHIDGVGRLRGRRAQGDSWYLEIEAPKTVLPYLVEKGSIAIQGVSLTVNELLGTTAFSVQIIGHTSHKTCLTKIPVGSPLNLEGDLIAKYVERLLNRAPMGQGITLQTLMQSGFTSG